MRKLLYIPICWMVMIILVGQVHAQDPVEDPPPQILSVKSHDTTDITDDNNIYHAGQNIAIDIIVIGMPEIDGTIQIESEAVGYDSGVQPLTEQGDDQYRYIWITTGLNPAKDYVATVVFKDQDSVTSWNTSLRMEIDNTEPKNGKIVINNDDAYAISGTVNLTVSADAATRMYISGDVIDDVTTFEWLDYREAITVTLSEGDGVKVVSIRFMDDARNLSTSVSDTIILDEMPPEIKVVSSQDATNEEDNDGIYHAGQLIRIVIETVDKDPIELEGTVQITSPSASYDSGLQTLTSTEPGIYTHIWNTAGLLEDNNYTVSTNLRDPSNRETNDSSLIIIIDNTPPSGGQVTINNGESETDSRSVALTLSATGEPREILLEGDLVDDTNTFEWVNYANQVVANLTDIDGEKSVTVKFRDAAMNVSGITTASITLNRQAPIPKSLIIEGGAEYTTTRSINVSLEATNAERMLIDGDIVDDSRTFDWISYSNKVTLTLSAGDGEKRVGVIFRNSVGIQSDRIEDTIILDTTEPKILSVDSSDSVDPQDNDEIFHSGQNIIISITAEGGEAGLDSRIWIRSQNTAYDTGIQEMSSDQTSSEFTYLWDTTALQESDDYSVWMELTDAAGHKAENSDLRITIDNSPPMDSQVIINDGDETANSRTVRLKLSATDVASVFLSGDLVEDSNTLQWVPYRTNMMVNLSGDDGEKTVYAKFRDAASNESVAVSDKIVLDRQSPYELKMVIASTPANASAGIQAEFATSQQVFLGLSATNALEMYISGDVAMDDGTWDWVPYSPSIAVQLTNLEGEKNIYVKFRNENAIESEQLSGTIILDTLAPEILSVKYADADDPTDDDGWYQPGEPVRITVEVVEANELDAKLRISSESTGYDSELQSPDSLIRIGEEPEEGVTPVRDSWRLEYVWNTADLDASTDYTIVVELEDTAGWAAISDPEIIVIDNLLPGNMQATVNRGAERTASRIVTLEASADGASEVYISGDVRNDSNTFRWVPMSDSMTLTLSSGDGIKSVDVRFRDMAENESAIVTASIILSKAAPVIDRVDSWDSSDLSDNDEIYHAGELIKIALKAESRENAPMIETGLLGTVSITSSRNYSSGLQEAREETGEGVGWYTYIWDTAGRAEGNYLVTWNLSDGVGHEVSDNSLNIIIDNTPPKNTDISINGGDEYTGARSVTLDLQASEASWAFISGDVIEESGTTFEWIPYVPGSYKISVKLSGTDGTKQVRVKYKDDADNMTESIVKLITLDTVGPDAISAKINEGAEYTASNEVDLAIVAQDAVMMYIDGDVISLPVVRQWIPYQENVSLKLIEEDGEKTVDIKFQDAAGNYSSEISDSIILDIAPPEILSVESSNLDASADNDDRYLKGTRVEIVANAEEAGLSATIQITSQEMGYSSGIQKMTDAGDGTYNYIWNTSFLPVANDYTAVIYLKDQAGNSTDNNSLMMAILDSPVERKISINDDEIITTSSSVLVTFAADNAYEMLISGSVVDDTNTFEWVEFVESKQLNLLPGDGVKVVTVAYRDSLFRETEAISTSIVLDQTPPTVVDVKTAWEVYRAGGMAEIIMQAGRQESDLIATIRVISHSTGYDSGLQQATEGEDGEYSYTWNTTGLKEDQDYKVEATFTDAAGWTARDNSLTLSIDNTPPEIGDFVVNDGELYTRNRSIRLALVPADPSVSVENVVAFIEGDLIDDSNTFQWVPVSIFNQDLVANLTVGDGQKRIGIRFRDVAGNISTPIEKFIHLNELPPVISAVASWDESNPGDDDEVYHAGQLITLSITADNQGEIGESQLDAWVQITSQESGYDSGILTATQAESSEFHLIWSTHSVPEASDYVVEAVLQDNYGQKAVDSSIIITMDNTPPDRPEISIESGKNVYNTKNVTLILDNNTPDATEMLIEGDVAESVYTFEWTPFMEARNIELSEGDGTKNITAKLRDAAGNISEPGSVEVVLNRSIPSSPAISINGGSEYTESHQVTLDLSVNGAREMYITGDVVQNIDTFQWVPFQMSYDVRLTEGEGEKTIQAVFRNGIDNESKEVEDTIVLDFSAPEIASIQAYDVSDEMDNDLHFHAGQDILIEAVGSEMNLKAAIFISESRTGTSDTGQQSMTDMGEGHYTYLWETESVADGEYVCEIMLEDVAGHSSTDTLDIVIDNQGPDAPTISIDVEENLAYSRTIEIALSASGEPVEVYIAGDVVDNNNTFEWIPFQADGDSVMNIPVNLRGVDGQKNVTAVFRDDAGSESVIAEAGIVLELKRPELTESCRIIQADTEPPQAYLALQFSESIGRIDPKNLFVTLRDRANPNNVVYLDGASTEPILSNDVVMLEIPSEQLDEIKQWQPMTFASSYIQVEIAENGVFDTADRGNLSNEQNPSAAYFVAPELSILLNVQPQSFSPNGDEVMDKIAISYSPAQTSDITIRIRSPQREIVREWQVADQIGDQVYLVEWDGRKLDDSLCPDGEYNLIIIGAEVGAAGFAYGLKQSFTIDNSVPKIVDIQPPEEERILPLFRAAITVVDMPQTGGIELVYVTIDGDSENQLELAKSEVEGQYVVPSISELLLSPGDHDVSFHVIDMAGNAAEETYTYTVIEETAAVEFSVMNFPNPFPVGETTNIRYSLPEEAFKGEAAIYDARGDMLFFREFIPEELGAGVHTFQWDGRDMFGNLLARGVYFCQFQVTTGTEDMSKIHKIAIR